MTKVVQIQIAQADYSVLKSGNYSLCCAQYTNGDYTVACRATLDYLESTKFSLLPNYQLFGTNYFTTGMPVVVETNQVDIDFGQLAVIDSAGILQPPENGSSPNSIILLNNYGPIYPGLIRTLAGPDGAQRQLPVCVSREVATRGTFAFGAIDKILIWFQQNAPTGMMLVPDIASTVNAIEVDLTKTDTATVQFENDQWSTIVIRAD